MKALRFILRWSLPLLLVVVIGVSLYLVSPAGLQRITPWLEHQIAERAQASVILEGLSLKWPLTVGIERLQIADADRVYVELHDAQARISSRRLLRRYLWIHRLHVGHVLFSGWPESAEETERETRDKALEWADLRPILSAFILTEGRIESIYIDAPLVPERIEGQLALRWGKGFTPTRDLVMDLRSNLGLASMKGQWNPGADDLKLGAQIDVPDLRALAPFIGQKIKGGMTLNLGVEGPAEQPKWGAQIRSESLAREEQMIAALHLVVEGHNVWAPHTGEVTLAFQREEVPVELRAVYRAEGSRYDVRDIDARVAEWLVNGGVSLDHSTRELDVDLNATGPQIDALSLKAEGDMDQTAWVINGTGSLPKPWSLDHAGNLIWVDGKPAALVLKELRGEWGEWEAFIEAPFELSVVEDTFVADPFLLRVGEGLFTMEGVWHPEQLNFDATVQDVPLSIFGFAGVSRDQGQMEGAFTLRGHPARPESQLMLDFSDILPANPDVWAGPPAQFTLDAQLEAQRLYLEARLYGLPGDPVALDWSMPLDVSLYPFAFTWPPEGPLQGRLNADTDLAELAALFVVDAHQLAGQLAVRLSVDGTYAEPAIAGSVRVRDGVYENVRSGTMLIGVEMDLVGAQDHVRLERFIATDGDEGELKLQGQLTFLPAENYPFTASAQLASFRLVRNDTAHAVGHGELQWRGTREASELAGRLRVYPVELRIPERLPPNIIQLDVIELDGPEVEEVEEAPPFEHELTLAVQVDFPDRFFVRGRGLDSEWGGGINVGGTAADPIVSGQMSVLRGRFVFLGKRLAITRGVIMLDGSFPPSPQLDVQAEARSGGITALMRLRGPVDAPSIELDSLPSMPEDEILARLLFGREATRITPFQALTIAQAVNRLRGGGHAFDVMGETRRRLRVDQIEIRDQGEEEGDLTVNVGKYVSDRIFVELERSLNAEGGRARVEVELTPRLRLESEVGVNAESGLGLLWMWDY